MALRNQPYLPLYVDDFQADERLIECSAASTGVYIRIMCLMHKSEEYGTILLKQKDKQTTKQLVNFAIKLSKFLPYPIEEIENALKELINERVLYIDEDRLVQGRMVKDNALSQIRSGTGRLGGFATANGKGKKEPKGKPKPKANTGLEYVNGNEYNLKERTAFEIAWDGFVEMRKKIKKPLTARAADMIKTKLKRLSQSESVQIQILDQSTKKCWSDVYELKVDLSKPETKRETILKLDETIRIVQ